MNVVNYDLLNAQLSGLLHEEHDTIANLANASALLYQILPDVNWVGFYLMKSGELILGPFQGKVACMHIAMGTGVCGTAATSDQIQCVDDVHAYPGHIACDGKTNSELVIPIHANGAVVAVLDLDSMRPARFTEADIQGLSTFAKILEDNCVWK